MDEHLHKRSLQKQRYRSSAKEVETINLHDLKVYSPLMKKVWTNSSVKLRKIPRISIRKSSVGRGLHQHWTTRTEHAPIQAGVVKKMVEKAENTRRHDTEPITIF